MYIITPHFINAKPPHFLHAVSASGTVILEVVTFNTPTRFGGADGAAGEEVVCK